MKLGCRDIHGFIKFICSISYRFRSVNCVVHCVRYAFRSRDIPCVLEGTLEVMASESYGVYSAGTSRIDLRRRQATPCASTQVFILHLVFFLLSGLILWFPSTWLVLESGRSSTTRENSHPVPVQSWPLARWEKKRCLKTRQKSKQKSSPFPFFSMSRVFKVCAVDPSTRLYGLALNMSAENGSSHNGFSLRLSSRWHKTLKPRVFFARSRL